MQNYIDIKNNHMLNVIKTSFVDYTNSTHPWGRRQDGDPELADGRDVVGQAWGLDSSPQNNTVTAASVTSTQSCMALRAKKPPAEELGEALLRTRCSCFTLRDERRQGSWRGEV